jgi:hypothetical protein
MILRIAHTWDGTPLGDDEIATVEANIQDGGAAVVVTVTAPYHGDPAPPAPAGSTDRLWEYEAVELFLLGRDDAYLEIELGPHGHHLVLQLRGRRNVVAHGLAIGYHAAIGRARWRGHAVIPRALLPDHVTRGNAYALHGVGPGRRHLAACPVPGPAPDFHRLDRFGSIVLR